MTHRGPDDAGIWIDGPVGLAHRRLSILDPSPAGHQPMSDPTGDVWIVYNGELYNYPALRKLCEDRGVSLRSHSDTETILHLWRFFGERMVDHMRGMFAFGLWDRRQRVLFLARDRFGQKPLYYADLPDRFLFASELKALRADPAFPLSSTRARSGITLRLAMYLTRHQSTGPPASCHPRITYECDWMGELSNCRTRTGGSSSGRIARSRRASGKNRSNKSSLKPLPVT